MSATDTSAKPQIENRGKSQPVTKTAKLFKNGRSQAVRLPKEFRFEGTEVAVRRDPTTGEVVLSQTCAKTNEDTWRQRFAIWDALGSPEDDVLERDQTPPIERDFF
ncbi:MAG: AbrB/MazE/SpoVT family DNA-binding domain-containing protein [Terracidiphilus sp.]|jgi:antitoxin VapB